MSGYAQSDPHPQCPLKRALFAQRTRLPATAPESIHDDQGSAAWLQHGYFQWQWRSSFRREELEQGDREKVYYSLALCHPNGSALSEEESNFVRQKVEGILNDYGVAHSIACMDSHYHMLVQRHQRISESELSHPDTDREHLLNLAHRDAARKASGLSQISFAVPSDAANVSRLLQAMSDINVLAPAREMAVRR